MLNAKRKIMCAVGLIMLISCASVFAKDYSSQRFELYNTNKKMPGTTVFVYESKILGYVHYINVRYGFTIDFPKKFTVVFLPANNDGARFALPDNSAEVSVWGGHSIGWSLDEHFLRTQQNAQADGGEIGYYAKGDDWFVVTW